MSLLKPPIWETQNDLVRERAYQTSLFGAYRMPGVVNVATVPMRSPFRYPGGKTWLVPWIRRWLGSRSPKATELIEPFAGGGIVGLTAAFEDYARRVTLVELDDDIAAVWQTILNGHARWLADRIESFELSPDAVKRVLCETPLTIHERAFATILKNRVNRGGILAAGAGLVKHGENGKGLRSRWYPSTLRRRILEITELRDRIQCVHADGIEYMKQNAHRNDAVFFIDPPYTIAGRRLYTHSEIDHCELFDVAASLAGDFLMTYDNAHEIRLLAANHNFETKLIPMKSTHHSYKYEILIGRDLGWAND